MSSLTLTDVRRQLVALFKARAQNGAPHSIHIDRIPLDVPIQDEDGTEAKQPWITVAVDRYSRTVVGFHIGFDVPNAEAVESCLRQALSTFARTGSTARSKPKSTRSARTGRRQIR